MIDDSNIQSVSQFLIDSRYMSVERFAMITSRKVTGVKEYLRKGKLVGKKDGAKWFVDWIWYQEHLRSLPANREAS